MSSTMGIDSGSWPLMLCSERCCDWFAEESGSMRNAACVCLSNLRSLGACGPRTAVICSIVGGKLTLAHQNRTIAIASDYRVDCAKSSEIPQKKGVLGSEIAARNRKSLATFHRTLKSQCNIALSCLGNRAISGLRDGHRNRKSQKSLRFRCAKKLTETQQRNAVYSRPDNYYIINSSGVQKCNVIFNYFLRGPQNVIFKYIYGQHEDESTNV